MAEFNAGAEIELWVGRFSGRDLKVVSFRGREAISRPFRFDIRVLAEPGDDVNAAALVGLSATLVLQLPELPPRVVQGVVSSVRQEGGATQGTRRSYGIRLVPRLWTLKKRITSRVFQDLTVPEIIALVLDGAGVAGAQKLTHAYAKRAYCLQYRESDLAFITRIAAEEGLFFHFEQPSGPLEELASAASSLVETVVFLDDPQSYPMIADAEGGGDSARLHLREHGGGGPAGSEDVTRFALGQALRSDGVLLRDYDFQRPLLELTADARTVPTPGLRVYDHRGEYDAPEVDPARAVVHLEQHRRRVQAGDGASRCRRLAPGYRFHLDAEATPLLSREYVVTAVRHEGHAPEYTSRAPAGADGRVETYSNTFECLVATIPARPRRQRARIQNVLESAVVVGPADEEIHTDAHGRIKIQFHWDLQGGLNERSSCWVRVVQPWAGTSFGAQFIPRIGMEVMVSFLGGDQDCPVVVGCVYNATHPVPFLLPNQKTRSGLRTSSTPGGGGFNELSFEDKKTLEQIYLHAQRDLDEVVERNHDVLVKGDEAVRVLGKQDYAITGARTEKVQGELSRAVARDERVEVGGNRVDVVTGNADLRVNGALATRYGAERRDVAGRADLSVGGDYTVRTKGCYATIVGRDAAKRSYVLRVEGTSQLSSSGVMEIDSEKGLTLKCGKSFIKISADKIELVSAAISAKGEGGGITVAKDKVKINAKGDAMITTDKMLIKTPDTSLSMKTDVQIDGKKILLNSPDQAKDPVKDTSPPPTKIQMKDQSGKPLSNQRFVIKLGDGSEYSGVLDKDGKTEMELDGSGTITFPDLAKPGGG